MQNSFINTVDEDFLKSKKVTQECNFI